MILLALEWMLQSVSVGSVLLVARRWISVVVIASVLLRLPLIRMVLLLSELASGPWSYRRTWNSLWSCLCEWICDILVSRVRLLIDQGRA